MNADLDKMTRIIESFSKEEHIHVLNILMEKDASCVSENSNGTFVQMDEVQPDTIDKIKQYIDYVLLKECDIKTIEDTKERLKSNINE
jgi:predicted small metal-binding protein